MAARAGAAASLAAINEKTRAAKAASTLALSLHHAFGVDHFNGLNYLMKLSERELQEERERLLAKAAAIDAALARKAAIAAFRDAYVLRQPRLADRAFLLETCVHKPLLDAIRGKRTAVLWGLLEEEADGVYSFPCLTREACDALLAETDAFCEQYDAAGLRATGDRPVAVLDAMGLGGLADLLLQDVIAPLSALLFPAICNPAAGGGALDYRHPFIIGYTNKERIMMRRDGSGSSGASSTTPVAATAGASATAAAARSSLRGATPTTAAAPTAPSASASGDTGSAGDAAGSSSSSSTSSSSSDGAPAAAAAAAAAAASSLLVRDSLVYHTDDAEVTLNVSLGRQFTGGELVLRGLRNAAGDTEEAARIAPQVGRGVLHLGTHFHEVLPVTSGERYAFIMWARSTAYRATLCPCCLTARRSTDGCICGAAFN